MVNKRSKSIHQKCVPETLTNPPIKFEFSGISAEGSTRDEATTVLIEKTVQRAHELFRVEFGSRARYMFRPKLKGWIRNALVVPVDFYWRTGFVVSSVTGPIGTRGFREPGQSIQSFQVSGHSSSCVWVPIPYYLIWNNPKKAIEIIKAELLATGKYPRLETSS